MTNIKCLGGVCVCVFIYIYIYDKVQLQNWLYHKITILLNKINITTYLENLNDELHIIYALNTLVKFCVNRYYLLYDL